MKREQQWECGGCGAGERWVLHNVRLRGNYRRLCTNCVLKNHEGLFCPICLHVYDQPPPPHKRLICLNCPSISHLSCAPPSSSSSFTCPPCSNPNFAFFSIPSSNKKPKSPSVNSNDNRKVIDKDSAKALVAAAKIAAASMAKAAALARVEAERKVKEAAFAKKRAKEALERLAYLASRDTDSSKGKPNNSNSVLAKAKT